MPYLTLNEPSINFATVTISLPDDEEWLAVLFGALTELAEATNWEQFGELSESEMSLIWDDIIQGIIVT